MMFGVAPLSGAWIETVNNIYEGIFSTSHPSRVRGLKLADEKASKANKRSHPSRVRGLKRSLNQLLRLRLGSHPSRVRGLKRFLGYPRNHGNSVAPLSGAWIETRKINGRILTTPVAPLSGAWIETYASRLALFCASVAPLSGAWIETLYTIVIGK
mgnify:CR=1 FL=1